MKGQEQQIKKAAANVGKQINREKAEEVKASMERAVRKGATAKDVLGLTDAMVEGIYGQAYRLYNTGKYKEAAQIFRLLLMINATEPKYSMGLAATLHMMKDYDSAIAAYAAVFTMDPFNPIPYYHSADCFIQKGDTFSAIIALQTAVKKSTDRPEYKTLQDRAVMMIESLKKELAKTGL